MKRITELPKLAQRPADGHKGTFGKVLIVGGSVGFSGAPALVGKAALRSGAGLVRVAIPASIQPVVAAIEPCYTTVALRDDANGQMAPEAAVVLMRMLADNGVIAFGPGAGTGAGVKETLLSLIAVSGLKLVIDADGLNVLASCGGSGGWLAKKKADVILTPHPGEMRRLWQSAFRKPMPENREECAAQFASKTKSIVVLKGAGTVVADGEKVYVNDTGNPGMATAGSGDVLTGVIAALIGQELSLFDAAVLGVHVHGLAGDAAAKIHGQVSMIAADIITHLGHAFIQATE
ncbi:MAG: NAD(P)H-hydrate dehydratase [Planctomycetales bacterium]|nr:NAD(P)H-hydrate dehydratase [Planctomycetales bacterium]